MAMLAFMYVLVPTLALLVVGVTGAAELDPAQRVETSSNMAYSPRIVGAQRPDLYSVDTLLRSPQFANKQGEELALALYNYFTSTKDGTYHFWSPTENEGEPRLRGCVVDPVKFLNAYGWMLCGNHATMLYQVYQAAGFKARQFGVPGHSLCEVFYEGRWHIIDIDMWTWFRTPDGHIASAYELAKNAKALIVDNVNKSNPCNLPDRDLPGYANMYAKTPTVDAEERVEQIWPHWATRAHTMDFALRPGETLIRSQVAQGRFHFAQSWKEVLKGIPHEWKGYPSERYTPLRTYGNGQWIYAPNLSAKYNDFKLGVWERQGLAQDDAGVVGQGSATIRIQSPYPFCGIPDITGEQIRHSNGVWLNIAGDGPATFEMTNAEGEWVKICEVNGPFKERVDITEQMASRYSALIRFTLGGKAKLTAFKFEGYILTAPMSLPRLVQGANKMEVCYLDKHQLCTVPWSRIIDFRTKTDFAPQAAEIVNGELRPGSDGWEVLAPKDPAQKVKVVFKVDAPAARKFAWLYAIGTVLEGPANQPPKAALLEWSLDGQNWAPTAGLRIPNTPLQWDSSIDAELLLAPQSAATVWLRLTSDTAIGGFQIHGHLEGEASSSTALEIVHRWTENGETRTFKAPARARAYSIQCGADPAGHTIEMSMPSLKRE